MTPISPATPTGTMPLTLNSSAGLNCRAPLNARTLQLGTATMSGG